jgi:predicted methyltransferase
MTIPGFFEGTGMPEPGWWEALWPDPAKVLSDVGIRAGMDVVDLCCGDGWFTFPLAKLVRSVVAIDIDGALLEAAKVRIAERAEHRIASLSKPTPITSAAPSMVQLTMCF